MCPSVVSHWGWGMECFVARPESPVQPGRGPWGKGRESSSLEVACFSHLEILAGCLGGGKQPPGPEQAYGREAGSEWGRDLRE